MNYLNLLTEMAKDHTVSVHCMEALDPKSPGWTAEAATLPKAMTDKPTVFHKAQALTPEGAIRGLYLLVNPIPRNERDGKLTQG